MLSFSYSFVILCKGRRFPNPRTATLENPKNSTNHTKWSRYKLWKHINDIKTLKALNINNKIDKVEGNWKEEVKKE